MDALTHLGNLTRFLHLWSAAAFAGLLFGLDWVLAPLLLFERGRLVPPQLTRVWLATLRWSGALAWGSGLAWSLGWLARQDPAGTGAWFLENQRGQWVSLAFGLASTAVFLVWFVASPRWEQLAGRPADDPNPLLPGWRTQASLATRLAGALLVPLLFAMGAARHLGEGGGDLPIHMGPVALGVSLAGVALGVVVSVVLRTLTRRALANPGQR